MYNREIHGFCSEFYTVEESIEVVVTTRGQSEPEPVNDFETPAIAIY